jgi:hypothetical protein
MKSPAQKVLEELVNSDVVYKTPRLFLWRLKYYEVLPYHLTLKRHSWSGYIKREHKGKTYMVREMTQDMMQKYYPKVLQSEDFSRAVELNPNLIVDK